MGGSSQPWVKYSPAVRGVDGPDVAEGLVRADPALVVKQSCGGIRFAEFRIHLRPPSGRVRALGGLELSVAALAEVVCAAGACASSLPPGEGLG
jgi:hypothetical protein